MQKLMAHWAWQGRIKLCMLGVAYAKEGRLHTITLGLGFADVQVVWVS